MSVRQEFANEPTATEQPMWYGARQELTRSKSPYVSCIDAIKCSLTPDQWRGMCLGTAIKYIWRSQDKGGATDLQKAIDYLNWAKESYSDDDE